MTRKYHDQLIERRQAFCDVTLDADRIKLSLDKVYPKAMARVAEEMENMMFCSYTVIEDDTLWLMQPDYGVIGSDDEFCAAVQELFNEENYEIIYKD